MMPTDEQMRDMRKRPFAYSDLFKHPEIDGMAFGSKNAHIREDIDPAIARVCKNESNCTIFLEDGTWFTTWSQGDFEHGYQERIVFALSRDEGLTWSEPQEIVSSSKEERVAYGAPLLIPDTGRIYLFFHVGKQRQTCLPPEDDNGCFHFVYSDDRGAHWSERRVIKLPDRDINVFPGRLNGWINHPPQIMPTGEVILPISIFQKIGLHRRAWKLNPAEVSLIRCDNILTETNPENLAFTLLPEGPRGIRVDIFKHRDSPALTRLLDYFGGYPEDTGFSFQEMTVVPLSGDRWLGVGRTFLGAVGYTISEDRGQTWTSVEPLRYAPDGDPIQHPMTMCPITKTSDGRFVLCFTNNDGSKRGAKHLWEGDGKTRNPQWIVVGCEIPGETRNAGVRFGEPIILAEVDDSGETNLKTGISMPQFLERDGRYFVCYNISKEHLLLDEIPAEVLDKLTPA